MGFVHGPGSAAARSRAIGQQQIGAYDDDLGAVTMIAGGGRSGAVTGGIPKTSAIRAAVAASGGDVASVRGPTRAPNYTPGVAAVLVGKRYVGVPQQNGRVIAPRARALTSPAPASMTTRGAFQPAPEQLTGKGRGSMVPRDRSGGAAGPGDFNPTGGFEVLRMAEAPGTMPAMVYGAPGGPVGVRRAFRTLSNDERSVMRAQVANDYGLSGYDVMQFSDDDLAGLSLKGIGKALTNVKNTVVKAVKDTGHVAGTAVTSKIGQAVIGTGLALTGVGLPLAAAAGAAIKGTGELIKPGGNLGKAAHGAVTGAATGVAAVGARTLLTKVAPGVLDKARGIGNKLLPGNPFKRVSTATAETAGLADRAAEIALGAGALAIPGVQITPSAPEPMPMIPPPRAAKLPPERTRDRSPVSTETKKRVATETIKAGQKAKGAANAGAEKLDALNAKIEALAGGLDKAKQAGDAIGADKISQMIADAQSKVAQVSSSIAGGGEVLRTAGAAAEGAAAGAVAGGAGAGISQWVSENPGKAAAIGLGTLGAIALIVRGGGRGSSSSSSAPMFTPPTFSVAGRGSYRRPRGAR